MTLVCQAAVGHNLPALNTYLPVLLVPLVVWRIHYWVRHHLGRQLVKTRRIAFRVTLFACIALGFTAVSLPYPRVMAGLAGGVALGILVAVLAGLRLTRFEHTPEGRFYTPNGYLGIALLIMLLGRLAYRFIMLHSAPPDFLLTYPRRFQSPLTAFFFGVTAGYYIAYYVGVLWRSRKTQPDA